MAFEFWVDIHDFSGTLLGAGPLQVTEWRTTTRMDRAGVFSFKLPLSDKQSNLVQPLRIAKAYAVLEGSVTILGIGIIETIDIDASSQPTMMHVSGNDLMHNLAFMSLGFAEFNVVTLDTAMNTLFAASSPWTHTLDAAGVGVGSIYYKGVGESTLQTLRTLCEAVTGRAHFYFDPNASSSETHIHIAYGTTDSGIRAVQAQNPLDSPELCTIRSFRKTSESFDLITRIYPYGAGNGEQRLTLEHATDPPPVGYTLDTINNYLKNDAAEALYGVRLKHLSYNDIRPIANSAQALEDASNALLTTAYNQLKNQSTEHVVYSLTVTGLTALLKPTQTIRVVYDEYIDGYNALQVDEDLVILEVETVADVNGVRTDSLVVSTLDKYPTDDFEVLAQQLESGLALEAHPQLTATKDRVGPYTRWIDSSHDAVFNFAIGGETTTLTYAKLRMTSSPLRSSVVSNEAESSHTHTVSIGASGAHTHDISHSHTFYVVDSGLAGSYPAVKLDTTQPKLVFDSGDAQHPYTQEIPTDTLSASTSASATHTHPATATSSGSTHTHGVTYGIHQDTQYPTNIKILVDGIDRTLVLTGASTIPGGSAVSEEYDITTYLEDQSTLRGTHSVTFQCASGQGEIEAEIVMLMSVQAIAVA